eukprot:30768_1
MGCCAIATHINLEGPNEYKNTWMIHSKMVNRVMSWTPNGHKHKEHVLCTEELCLLWHINRTVILFGVKQSQKRDEAVDMFFCAIKETQFTIEEVLNHIVLIKKYVDNDQESSD